MFLLFKELLTTKTEFANIHKKKHVETSEKIRYMSFSPHGRKNVVFTHFLSSIVAFLNGA